MDIFKSAKKASFFFLFLSFGLTQASFFDDEDSYSSRSSRRGLIGFNDDICSFLKCRSDRLGSQVGVLVHYI